jgi:hypothetical protein
LIEAQQICRAQYCLLIAPDHLRRRIELRKRMHMGHLFHCAAGCDV